MAIDRTKTVINNTRFADGVSGATISDEIGVDDGNDFVAGTVVRLLDGTLSLATERQKAAYVPLSSRDEAVTAYKAFVASIAAIDAATDNAGVKAAVIDALNGLKPIFRYIDSQLREDI